MFLLIIGLSLILKLASFLPVHRDWLWTLKLVVTELGHLATLFLLIACGLFYFLAKPARWRRLTLIFGLATAALYAYPLFQALRLQGHWQQMLARAFPGTQSPPLGINFLKLLTLQTSEIAVLSHPAYAPVEEVYSERGAQKLHILNYHRDPKVIAPAWVLVVHGGGWDVGKPDQLSPLNYAMEEWGYGVFALEYSLSGTAVWPTPVQDIFRAIAWIQANASRLGVNPDQGFLIGRSAGGQLALSACYSGKVKAIQGCVAFYAPTDMEVAYIRSSPDDFFRPIPRITAVMGGTPAQLPQAYMDASPLRYAEKARAVPTLLLHGLPDFWVWNGHSRALYSKLLNEGVPVAYLEFPWANHGFDVNLNGPAGQLSTQAVEWFLKNETKKF